MHRRLVVGLLLAAAIVVGGRYAFGDVDQQSLSLKDTPIFGLDGNNQPIQFVTFTMTSWKGGAGGYTASGTVVPAKDGAKLDPASVRFHVIRQSDGKDNMVVVGINTLNNPWTWECTVPTDYASIGKNPYYFEAVVGHKDFNNGDDVTVPTSPYKQRDGNYLGTTKNNDEPGVAADIEDLWAYHGDEEIEVGPPQSPSLCVEEDRVHETNKEWRPRELTVSAVEMPYCRIPLHSDPRK